MLDKKPTRIYDDGTSGRARNQFKRWLTFTLQQQGAQIPDDPSYQQLKEAVETYLIGERK